jgi:hypothetical protein
LFNERKDKKQSDKLLLLDLEVEAKSNKQFLNFEQEKSTIKTTYLHQMQDYPTKQILELPYA